MEHDHLAEYILEDISFTLIKFIRKYYTGYSFSQEFFKSGIRLIESITSHIQLIGASLSKSLMEEMRKGSDEKCLEIVRLIVFLFEKLI